MRSVSPQFIDEQQVAETTSIRKAVVDMKVHTLFIIKATGHFSKGVKVKLATIVWIKPQPDIVP